MRKSFNMLSGIVNNDMRQNLYSGDVFVFVNASNNMMKLLRYEPGGLVIYNKRLDHGRMHLVERIQEDDPTITPFEWRRLVDTIQGIVDDPRRRLQRLKVLRDIQMEASLKEAKTSENQQNKLRGTVLITWQDNAFYSVQFRDMELKILGIANAEKVLDAVKDYVENGEVWV